MASLQLQIQLPARTRGLHAAEASSAADNVGLSAATAQRAVLRGERRAPRRNKKALPSMTGAPVKCVCRNYFSVFSPAWSQPEMPAERCFTFL